MLLCSLPFFSLIFCLGQIHAEQQICCCVLFYLRNNVQNHDQHHGEKRGGKCVYPTGFHGSITAVTTAGVNSHRNGADCNLSYQRQLSDASGSEWVFLPSWKGTRVCKSVLILLTVALTLSQKCNAQRIVF